MIKVKIGILTASRTNNIGTDLQALAMQLLFSGATKNTVELINYKCKKLENSRKIVNKLNIKSLLSIPWSIFRNINHNRFRKKFFNYSSKIYDFSNLSDSDYSKIVVGSDQIWNLSITGGDTAFFLPFKTETKKYSYAASLGKTDIAKWAEKIINDFELYKGKTENYDCSVFSTEKVGECYRNIYGRSV